MRHFFGNGTVDTATEERPLLRGGRIVREKSRQRKHGHSRRRFSSELLNNKGLGFLYCLFQRSEEL